jgi:hypothetical protein
MRWFVDARVTVKDGWAVLSLLEQPSDVVLAPVLVLSCSRATLEALRERIEEALR